MLFWQSVDLLTLGLLFVKHAPDDRNSSGYFVDLEAAQFGKTKATRGWIQKTGDSV